MAPSVDRGGDERTFHTTFSGALGILTGDQGGGGGQAFGTPLFRANPCHTPQRSAEVWGGVDGIRFISFVAHPQTLAAQTCF